MRESKRLKRKATRRSAKERKLTTKRRTVTNVDAAATMESNTKPRWKDPRQESQMMRMMSSKFIQVSQNDQS